MRNTLILLFFWVGVQIGNAQNIVDFFYSMPNEYVDELSFLERKNLVNQGSIEKYDMRYSLEIDLQNGYLRLGQSYTEGQSGYQVFEMTYWNVSNGKKLIAISTIGGSNGGFFQSNFKFFEYEKSALKELKTGYLKSYSSNIDVFMNNLVSEFTNSNVPQSIKDELISYQFVIELPKNGKDISVSFQEDGMTSGFFEKHYAPYLKIKEKKYIWNKSKQSFE